MPDQVRIAARWVTAALAVGFFVPALLAALVLPYHEWDAMSFGEWSRLIALHHRFHFSVVQDVQLQRPLFYAGQGALWAAFGFHEWLGRLYSLFFSAVLVASCYGAAGSLVEAPRARALVRALAVGIALATVSFAQLAEAGLTDVPVAATAAATAGVLWSGWQPRVRLPGIAVAAALTMLAKPTGLLPLAGLGAAAVLLGERRLGKRLYDACALSAGVLIGLAYDQAQALHLHESLPDVLRAGVSSYYTAEAARVRAHVLMRADWLGVELRLLLLYGLLYAIARAARLSHRISAGAALAGALVWSIAGPIAADGGTPFPFAHPVRLDLAVWAATVVVLAGSVAGRGTPVVTSRRYAYLLVWLAPSAAAWVVERIDYLRLLSPAWPALFLIVAAAFTDAVTAFGPIRVRLWPAPAAAMVVVIFLVAVNLPQLDALGMSSWRSLLRMGPSGWTDQGRARHLVAGPFVYELEALHDNLGSGKVKSSDGKLRFFYPGRVDQNYPTSCAELTGYRMFVLLLDEESSNVMRSHGGRPDPLSWQQCASPTLREVGERSGVFAAFTVGAPSAPASAADCGVSPTAGTAFDAVLASGLPYRLASAAEQHAVAAGFRGAQIERTSCDRYRVVVRGVTSATDSIDAEARSAGFTDAAVRPALRYPAVPTGAMPSR